MTYPSFTNITQSPSSLGVPKLGAPPLEHFEEPIILETLTEEELARSDQDQDPLVPVEGNRIVDLRAYWDTGMRSTMPQSLIRASLVPILQNVVGAFPSDWGLAVFDAYRPLALQRRLYSSAYAEPGLEPGYVSVPSDNPLTPPAHVTGGALDLTLTWKNTPLSLGTNFDEFVPRSARDALEGEDTVERDLRRALNVVLLASGFVPYVKEWWHFEYGTPRWAAMRAQRPIYAQPNAFES